MGASKPRQSHGGRLAAGLPAVLARDLWNHFACGLNTPASQASARFLRVLRDALFSGPGSADLLLPRQPLGQLLPEPAQRWSRLGRVSCTWVPESSSFAAQPLAGRSMAKTSMPSCWPAVPCEGGAG